MGLGVLLVLVCFYLIRSGNEIIKKPIFKELTSGAGVKLKDIHYTHDDPDEGMKWVLDAGEVRSSRNGSRMSFHDFRLRLEPTDRPWFKLKGKRGRYSKDSGEITLSGDVDGHSGNGYRIVTEHILINEKKRHLMTDKAVKIFGPFFSVAGKGLFVDIENEKLKILSDVTTVVHEESLI